MRDEWVNKGMNGYFGRARVCYANTQGSNADIPKKSFMRTKQTKAWPTHSSPP